MSFKYKNFVDSIHNEFKEDFSLEEVRELLSVSDKYDKDITHEKSLTIKRLKFNGNKSKDNQIDDFDFDKEFDKGINLLVADNLKGKSSVLKIIKFCLTGSKKVREGVFSWIRNIYLEFSINDELYTCFIDVSGWSQKSILFKLPLEVVLKEESKEEDKVFETNGNDSYVDEIEDFFFNQYEFYNLQWTQKDGKKDSNRMLTANASWKLYYNNLNLESKDSTVMDYGGQEGLSYQMLLGLKLTYPINRLKVKKEKKEHDSALINDVEEKSKESKKEILESLKNQFKQKESEKESISLSKTINDNTELIKKRNEFGEQITAVENRIRNNESKLKVLLDKLVIERQEYKDHSDEIISLKKEKSKNLKKKNDLSEYLEIGVFFTNLDVHTCPHCNHDVDENQKIKEKENKECMLCNHVPDEPLTDTNTYEERIKDLQRNIDSIEEQILLYEKKNTELIVLGKTTNERITDSQDLISSLKEELGKNIKEHEDIGVKLIQAEKENLTANDKRMGVLKDLAVLEYRINQLEKDAPSVDKEKSNKIKKEINLLKHAIDELITIRLKENEGVIKQLEDLIFSELKDLGIEAIEEVKIEKNFKVKYKIDGYFEVFDKISEGEQLRAKLAFYLGLIQLNIKSGNGKHPRFLIIDSPAKEEADNHFLDGLKKVIEEVNDRYGEQLQIIICTSKREFENVKVSGKKYIMPKEEFVF